MQFAKHFDGAWKCQDPKQFIQGIKFCLLFLSTVAAALHFKSLTYHFGNLINIIALVDDATDEQVKTFKRKYTQKDSKWNTLLCRHSKSISCERNEPGVHKTRRKQHMIYFYLLNWICMRVWWQMCIINRLTPLIIEIKFVEIIRNYFNDFVTFN